MTTVNYDLMLFSHQFEASSEHNRENSKMILDHRVKLTLKIETNKRGNQQYHASSYEINWIIVCASARDDEARTFITKLLQLPQFIYFVVYSCRSEQYQTLLNFSWKLH